MNELKATLSVAGLPISTGGGTWEKIKDKPFEVIGETLVVNDGVLDVGDLPDIEELLNEIEEDIDEITDNIAEINQDLTELEFGKLDRLTAGNNITITDNVISATDTKQVMSIDPTNTDWNEMVELLHHPERYVCLVKDEKYQLAQHTVDVLLDADHGIISFRYFKLDSTTTPTKALWRTLTANMSNHQWANSAPSINGVPNPAMGDKDKVLTAHEDLTFGWEETEGTTYTAGDNIDITNNVISAVDTIYDDSEITARIEAVENKIKIYKVVNPITDRPTFALLYADYQAGKIVYVQMASELYWIAEAWTLKVHLVAIMKEPGASRQQDLMYIDSIDVTPSGWSESMYYNVLPIHYAIGTYVLKCIDGELQWVEE